MSACEFLSPTPAAPLEDEAAIAGEIAERILELEDLRVGLGADFIFRLNQIFVTSPAGFITTLELLRGNTGAVRESFEEMSERTGHKKQTHHYHFHASARAISRINPVLGAAIEESRRGLCEKTEAVPFHKMMQEAVEQAQHDRN